MTDVWEGDGVAVDDLTLPLHKRIVSNRLRTMLLALDNGSTVERLFRVLVAVVIRVKNRLLLLLNNV